MAQLWLPLSSYMQNTKDLETTELVSSPEHQRSSLRCIYQRPSFVCNVFNDSKCKRIKHEPVNTSPVPWDVMWRSENSGLIDISQLDWTAAFPSSIEKEKPAVILSCDVSRQQSSTRKWICRTVFRHHTTPPPHPPHLSIMSFYIS